MRGQESRARTFVVGWSRGTTTEALPADPQGIDQRKLGSIAIETFSDWPTLMAPGPKPETRSRRCAGS